MTNGAQHPARIAARHAGDHRAEIEAAPAAACVSAETPGAT
jgi:hypothetical protein